ncbi:hypothetical protein MTR67_014885 [Solanum verrucosum]|uniref:Uncharacterized protein n=1 Tax=Solanum verrucosum TaxID=315347 RepID=A0AAF0QFV9_SOLVR|nr:hypothetical protein MTR67_014885 [Solanum verrucosum]
MNLNRENREEMQEIMANIHIQVMYISREVNQLADCIANLAINQEEKQHYDSFHNLPYRARRILNMDKQHTPTIRIKTKRIKQSPTR